MLEQVLDALMGRGCHPRKSGSEWKARCPAHDDRNPSLAIREADDGRVLMYCHAGCAAENIVAVLGLQMKDLMPVNTKGENHFINKENPTDRKTYATAEEAKEAWVKKMGRWPDYEWMYFDATDRDVGCVLRWDKPDGKIILPVSLYDDGWRHEGMPAPRPLFALPLIRKEKDATVFVMEGEKAADAGWDCELVSTTSAGGANAAHKTDWSPLRGRRVVILPDNDEAGERYAETVAQLCLAAGVTDIRIIKLADYAKDLPPGGDLADIIISPNRCGLPLSPEASRKEIGRWLLEVAGKTELWRPKPVETTQKTEPNRDAKRKSGIWFSVRINSNSRRQVVVAYENDKEVYRDVLNVHSSQAREEFARKLASKLGRDLNEMIKRCDSELPRAADEEAEKIRESNNGAISKSIVPPWPDEWPEPVKLSDVLDEVYNAIRRYVILKHEDAVAITLWAAWTYVYNYGHIAPMLGIVSPTRRCGKTTLLTILFHLVARPIFASNISPAAVFRVIEECGPLTLLIDEADTFTKDNEELKNVINSGHQRYGSHVVRAVPRADRDYGLGKFSTWCAKAIASIGSLHNTWSDRAITICMQRKTKDEIIERLTPSATLYLQVLSRKLYTAVATEEIKEALATRYPDVPETLHDRAADNWRPLLCIADAAGGEWPTKARETAKALSGSEEVTENEDVVVRLLLDSLEVFGADEMLTARELAERLAALEEAPWATYRYGKPISPEQVGKYLRRFGIKIRRKNKSRLYSWADIEEAARKYSSSESKTQCDDFTDKWSSPDEELTD